MLQPYKYGKKVTHGLNAVMLYVYCMHGFSFRHVFITFPERFQNKVLSCLW